MGGSYDERNLFRHKGGCLEIGKRGKIRKRIGNRRGVLVTN